MATRRYRLTLGPLGWWERERYLSAAASDCTRSGGCKDGGSAWKVGFFRNRPGLYIHNGKKIIVK